MMSSKVGTWDLEGGFKSDPEYNSKPVKRFFRVRTVSNHHVDIFKHSVFSNNGVWGNLKTYQSFSAVFAFQVGTVARTPWTMRAKDGKVTFYLF